MYFIDIQHCHNLIKVYVIYRRIIFLILLLVLEVYLYLDVLLKDIQELVLRCMFFFIDDVVFFEKLSDE